jgi:spermidine synthase
MSRENVDLEDRVDAFFIVGGAYAFQRWVASEWPGSRVDVAEIDPVVVEANIAATGLESDTPIRTYIGDARNVVDDLPADAKYDFVFGDAFSDLSVPFHLTTLEFTRKVSAHLKPHGAYLVNIIDDFRFGRFLGAYVRTLQRVFRHVYVFCTNRNGVSAGRETFVVAGSDAPLDVSDMGPYGSDSDAEDGEDAQADDEQVFHGSALTQENLAELARKSGGRILTDDDAPVENLLAPVVRTRADR